MKRTNQITPEIQMKATEYINLGYQRLFNYEVPGGGFEVWGKAPANRVLTAYGLLEFSDMDRVYNIDPALIPRTQRWLAGQQNPDGSWSPDKSYAHSEMWGSIQNNDLVTTCYITYALAASGYRGGEFDKALAYIRKHAHEAEDNYSLAHLAQALAAIDPDDDLFYSTIQKLKDQMKETKDEAYWESPGSMSFARGDVANIETTAMVAIALQTAKQEYSLITKNSNLSREEKRSQWNMVFDTIHSTGS